MNPVWEVEEPINIWHVSWICLHNWCGNLNWIIIASLWTFRPLVLSLFFLSFVSHSPWYFSQDQIYPLNYHFLTHTSYTHTYMHSDGCRQTINVISGYEWHMVLMNPLGSVSLCLPLCLWLTAVPPLSFTHTHWKHWLSPTSCCSPVSCGADILWHTLCLMPMSNSLSSDCVCACVCALERGRERIRFKRTRMITETQ